MAINDWVQVFQPQFDDEEVKAVSDVLGRKWPGRGIEVDAFEIEFANYLKVPRENLISTNSCTEAVFQILELLNLPGYDVILPTNSFIGVGNAVMHSGMNIVFCDVSSETGNPTIEDIISAQTSRTRILIVQHYGGYSADMQEIISWARINNVIVIEDSAGALGSQLHRRHCGTFGDFGVWSLDAMKMVVAGDGGMIYCRDPLMTSELKQRMYLGLVQTTGLSGAQSKDKWWEFDVSHPGRRSIMNDISASIARVQLKKLPQNIAKRRINATIYRENLASIDVLRMPTQELIESSNNYFFPIQFEGGSRDIIANHLYSEQIYTTFRYFPLNKLKLFSDSKQYPNSDRFANETLLIPQHPGLREHDLERICNAIRAGMAVL